MMCSERTCHPPEAADQGDGNTWYRLLDMSRKRYEHLGSPPISITSLGKSSLFSAKASGPYKQRMELDNTVHR